MSMLLLTMGPQLSITRVPTVIAVGSAGAVSFRAVGANGNVAWYLVNSTLPAEWATSISVTDGIASITTSEAINPGTYSVTVRAVDGSRQPVVIESQVNVVALPVTISGAFPDWEVGNPVSGSLSIVGGVPPYNSLSILSGAMPDGVSLYISGSSIVATGMASITGEWSATISLLDAVGAPGTISLSGEVIAATYTTWDPSYLSPSASIVNNDRDLIATASVGYRSTRSISPLAGNVYFSISANRGSANNYGMGVADETAPLLPSGWVGDGNSGGLWYEGRMYVSGSMAGLIPASGRYEFAVRTATRQVWVRIPGGAWIGGGDPVAATTPTMTIPGSGLLYAAGSLHVPSGFASAYVRIEADPSDVTGVTPSGFVRGIIS